MTTRIICPKCQAEIEAEESTIHEGVLCQSCGTDFAIPEQGEPQPGEPPVEEKTAHPLPDPPKEHPRPVATSLTKAERLLRRRSEIRQKAEGLEFTAGIFCILSIVIFGGGVVASLAGADGGFWAVGLGAGGLSLAAWLYLVAQIVHIRANTER